MTKGIILVILEIHFQKSMIDKKLEVVDVFRLHKIFSEKKWFSNPGQENVHDNFCLLLSNLTNSQKDLIFDLCSRYLWLTLKDYLDILIEITGRVDKSVYETSRRIIVFPIIKPEDAGKVKSSATLLYQFKGLPMMNSYFKDVKVDVIDSYDDFFKETLGDNDRLFLVDDYLGSGETIEATLSELGKNKTVKSELISIFSLAAQSAIVKKLSEQNIPCYVKYEMKRGISDFYENPVLQDKIADMKEIERLIPGDKFFTFGFNQSEALVTLTRTPDNTFPIFWRDHKKSGITYKAPFHRY